ncbi:MAG: TldD/PmbA family protein [Thermoplasmatota archaeon]
MADSPKQLAESVVAKALSRGADAAEAFVLDETGEGVRIERGVLAGGASGREFGIAVRVRVGKRGGFAYFTDPSKAPAAIAGALAGAKFTPEATYGFPSKKTTPRVAGLFDKRVESLSVEDGIEACETMLAAARDRAADFTVTGGGVGWGVEHYAVANSEGVASEFKGTSASGSLSGVLRNGETTTGFEFDSARAWKPLDFKHVGREAADLALRSRGAKKLASGKQTVVARATALDGLFEALFLRGLIAENAASGGSVWSGKVGKRVMPTGFGFADDGTLAGAPNSAPFDDEGVPSRKGMLVEKGVLRGYLEDVAGASERGGRATGSAIRTERLSSHRSFRAPPKAQGRNLYVVGKKTRVEDLIGDVKKGVLVYDAMGAHTANVASGDFNVNSSTIFAIRNGEIAHAGKPALVSGNLPKALASLAAIGNDARSVGGGFSPANFVLPTMRFEGLRVTAS